MTPSSCKYAPLETMHDTPVGKGRMIRVTETLARCVCRAKGISEETGATCVQCACYLRAINIKWRWTFNDW